MLTSIPELYSIYLKNSTISTDSRQIQTGCLFFALKGDNFDGNQYAISAVESGAAFAVIDDPDRDGEKMLLVPDVLNALQQLAQLHRRHFKIPILAITGSNGKTTTKELINAVLSRQFRVTATKGNLNNHIGVPLTLLSIAHDTQAAIIEMGANHQGEIELLCSIAEPTHGLITNIGKAHLGGFGGYEGVIKAKSELYAWLRYSGGEAFVNAGNQLLMNLTAGMKRVLYGDQENLFTHGELREAVSPMELNWYINSGAVQVSTQLIGSYNFENVLAAICVGTFFGVSPTAIQSAVSTYFPSNSRSQLMETASNSIILDAYNANPSSMQVAIENFRNIDAQNKMVLLGDMLELGEESDTEHQAIVKMITASAFEKAIFVGPDFMKAAGKKFPCFPTSVEARDWLLSQNIKGYTILIKGSRGIKMERVLDVL